MWWRSTGGRTSCRSSGFRRQDCGRSDQESKDHEQRNLDGGRRRIQREGRRQGNHLRRARGGARIRDPQEARRGARRARCHQPQDRRLRHVPPLEGVRRRLHRARGAGARAAHGRRARHRQGRGAGRLRRGADGIGALRPHPRADRQAGDRAEGARGRARAGGRCLQGPRRHAGERHRQARRPQRRLRRSRRECRGLHRARGDDSARARALAGPHQGVPQGSALRAARSAAVPVAHRAGIPDRAVQARGAGSRARA